MKPYTLADRKPKAAVLLPESARNRLISEAAQIKRVYKQALLRNQALDLLIEKIKSEYPECFLHEAEVPNSDTPSSIIGE